MVEIRSSGVPVWFCCAVAAWLGSFAAGAAPAALPHGAGLAAQYPGDAGIGRDPRVLLAESFETGSLDDLAKRWSDVSNQDKKVMAFAADVPAGSASKRSLQVTATRGQNTGGHLYSQLSRSVDTAFARFYVKFSADAEYIHHFVHFGGYNPATRWPQGGAGEQPRGDERITVGIEPHGDYGRFAPPGAWTFYCYWQDMKISADNKYWGNGLHPVRPALVPRDRWQCVEIMVKLNSEPELADGELALWLDGDLTAHFLKGAPRTRWTGMGFSLADADQTPKADDPVEPFEGFRWRKSTDLKLNFFWLLHYVTENAARQNNVANPKPSNRVWFDNIVVATDYVGPVKK